MAALPSSSPSLPEIDRLRSTVAAYFPVYESRISPRSLVLTVHADPATLEARFDALRRELWERQYIAQIRLQGGEYFVEVVRRPPRAPWSAWSNLLLLALTIASTIAAGAFLWLDWRGGTTLEAGDWLWGGVYFALPLLGILGVHELGHYVMARHHHVEASLPYFIPVPPPLQPFGTFGAFISLRQPIPSKKVLMDIGASGPLAGFVLAIPVTLGGLLLSAHSVPPPASYCGPTFFGLSYGNLAFGGSLVWSAIGLFVPAQAFLNLQPLAIAGWVGILVTAINLLPAGQLDGGHVFRALLGERARFVSYGAVAVLFFLGFAFGYLGWLLFAFLVFVLGIRHPPPLNDISPLDGKRVVVGALAVAILVGGFVVVPIASPTNSFSATGAPAASGVLPPVGGMTARFLLTVTDEDFASHGYTLSGLVDSVNAVGPNATAGNLSQQSSFAANSTWVVTFPNGTSYRTVDSASFSLPADLYLTLAAGGKGTLTVDYFNSGTGTPGITLSVGELCSSESKNLYWPA